MARLPSCILLLALSSVAAHAEELAMLQVMPGGADAPDMNASFARKTSGKEEETDLDLQGIRMTHYATGAMVRVVGLEKAELNGKKGLVRGWDTNTGRWKVVLVPGGQGKLLKVDNVEPMEPEQGDGAQPVDNVMVINGKNFSYSTDSEPGNAGMTSTMSEAIKTSRSNKQAEVDVNDLIYNMTMARKFKEQNKNKNDTADSTIFVHEGNASNGTSEALVGGIVAEVHQEVHPHMSAGVDADKIDFDSQPREDPDSALLRSGSSKGPQNLIEVEHMDIEPTYVAED